MVVLNAGEIEVYIGRRGGTERLVIESKKEVEFNAEQYVLIELRSVCYNCRKFWVQNWFFCCFFFSSDNYSLYFNGELQNFLPSIPELDFGLSTSPPLSDTSPVLYVGGIPSDLVIQGIPSQIPEFVGCMKDLAYNFRSAINVLLVRLFTQIVRLFHFSAMSFINPALSIQRRYPAGVSYNTCPFVNVSLDPLIAVHPDMPMGRVCLAATPSLVEGTHGGFHKLTTLTTSNIIGLISR